MKTVVVQEIAPILVQKYIRYTYDNWEVDGNRVYTYMLAPRDRDFDMMIWERYKEFFNNMMERNKGLSITDVVLKYFRHQDRWEYIC